MQDYNSWHIKAGLANSPRTSIKPQRSKRWQKLEHQLELTKITELLEHCLGGTGILTNQIKRSKELNGLFSSRSGLPSYHQTSTFSTSSSQSMFYNPVINSSVYFCYYDSYIFIHWVSSLISVSLFFFYLAIFYILYSIYYIFYYHRELFNPVKALYFLSFNLHQ